MLIAVTCATGKQGTAVIAAARESPDGLAVRAIVRNARSPAATALTRRVDQVVEADLDDANGVRKAFEGCDAAYCVTPPDTEDELGRETTRAKNMATAARDARLEHVIWSTQEDTRHLLDAAHSEIPMLGGRYRVPSYDAKAEADAVFRELGVPTTFMRTSFYWESLFAPHIGPRPTSDGCVIRWPLGAAKLPGIAVADIGRCAVGLFERRSSYVGRTVGICGEQLTGFEIAAALGDILGVDCRYEPIEPAEFRRHLPRPSAQGTTNMFQYKRDFAEAHTRSRSVAVSRSLNPRLTSFRDWLAEDATQAAFRGMLTASVPRTAATL